MPSTTTLTFSESLDRRRRQRRGASTFARSKYIKTMAWNKLTLRFVFIGLKIPESLSFPSPLGKENAIKTKPSHTLTIFWLCHLDEIISFESRHGSNDHSCNVILKVSLVCQTFNLYLLLCAGNRRQGWRWQDHYHRWNGQGLPAEAGVVRHQVSQDPSECPGRASLEPSDWIIVSFAVCSRELKNHPGVLGDLCSQPERHLVTLHKFYLAC